MFYSRTADIINPGIFICNSIIDFQGVFHLWHVIMSSNLENIIISCIVREILSIFNNVLYNLPNDSG